jgi:hypothetical protein
MEGDELRVGQITIRIIHLSMISKFLSERSAAGTGCDPVSAYRPSPPSCAALAPTGEGPHCPPG